MNPRSVAELGIMGYDLGGMMVRVKGEGLFMVSGMEPIAIRIGYSRRGVRRLLVNENPAEWFPELSSPTTAAIFANVARSRWQDPTLHAVPMPGGSWFLASAKKDTPILLKPNATEVQCWLFALAEADAYRDYLRQRLKGEQP